jgi:DNA invertase Pin-like site-specific DNA recombinase
VNPKIRPEHLARAAVVYVRQSTLGQVEHHTESKRLQYSLADTASVLGFASVETIDDDLGRSGSGLVERPGFQKLVAMVCGGTVGAVVCIEASRLARNGRDWHHLIDLCALVGTVVIDPDGVYDPRLMNDRLLLGLKGTMSEYELSLLRQRGLAARDSKAQRGELKFALPPGYCWNELGQIEMDADERVCDTIRMILRKFRELGSARQVLLWAVQNKLQLPVMRPSERGPRIAWHAPAYHTVLEILQHPVYAGAYVFGRTTQRTTILEGRAKKTVGHKKPMPEWNVLIPDHHSCYISWEEFQQNQRMIGENAHMQKRTDRKSARGGRALLAGLVRCGRCGRMMRVFYGSSASHAHRYLCRGNTDVAGGKPCIGAGGIRVDRMVSSQILEAVSAHAIEAAMQAAERSRTTDNDVHLALSKELEAARYEASLAARRYELVDPAKRLVARELEGRWNTALERVDQLERRVREVEAQAMRRPQIDQGTLLALAQDLPAAWNASGADARTKQRLTRILIQEVVIDDDAAANQIVLVIHWTGGRHTEVRVAKIRTGRYPDDRHPSPVEVMRILGGHWPDRELAVTMNRMRCKTNDGSTWTVARVRELRERLEISAFDATIVRVETITVDEAAHRLNICVGSVKRLIREGVLPAKQLMPSAPWQIPTAALTTEAVKIGVRNVIERRPRNFSNLQDLKILKLPGF